MSAPRYDRGDIVHCLFEHGDRSGASRRFALIVGDPLANSHGDYVLIQITSTLFHGPTDFILADSHPEFAQTGLDNTSTFRCHKLITLVETAAGRKRGSVGPDTMREIEIRLRKVLALAS